MLDTDIFRYPYIHISGSLPNMVESELHRTLYEQKLGLLTSGKVEDVAEVIRSKKNPIYKTDWASFSYLYFAANYVKAFLAARAVSPPIPDKIFRVLDLGCGAGPATIGVLSALRSSLLKF